MSGEIPKSLGRYQIDRELGRGMMGVVYSATDPHLGRRVALKTIRIGFAVPESERAVFEERFKREAKAAAVLSHPGIVVVHDVGEDPATKTTYIALEYMEGRTLAELVAGGAPLDWAQASRLAAQVAEALHHAHSKKIIHRDIKPANVMVLDSGQAKVMDFGIARLDASTLTSTGEFFGTPAYMSPEQAKGDAVDARTDLFSLGCVLYQLLTGRKPFDATSVPAILMRVMQETPSPPSRVQPGVPPGLDLVVARALAKDKEARYSDGQSMAEDLMDVVAGRPPRHASASASARALEATRVSAPRPAVSALPPGPGPATSRLATVLDVAAGTSVMREEGPSGRKRRQLAFLGLGAASLVAAGFVAALVIPWRGQRPILAVPTLAPLLPGQLEITVQHSLKTGVMKVWVDDRLVLQEELEGRVSKKILSYREHKGSLKQTVDVLAGERTVRVEVEGDGFTGSRRIKGTFASGETRRLYAEISGLLKKDLKLGWSS
jgi:tRNA A-37 threonylcarbamoyl transferase component Bud32